MLEAAREVRFDRLPERQRRRVSPAARVDQRDACGIVFDIECQADPLRSVTREPTRCDLGLFHSRASDDGAVDTRVHQIIEHDGATQPTANLQAQRALRRHRDNDRPIRQFAVSRTVQIDDMQPACA